MMKLINGLIDVLIYGISFFLIVIFLHSIPKAHAHENPVGCITHIMPSDEFKMGAHKKGLVHMEGISLFTNSSMFIYEMYTNLDTGHWNLVLHNVISDNYCIVAGGFGLESLGDFDIPFDKEAHEQFQLLNKNKDQEQDS